ncbi:MAG: ATP-dependent DNA helicase RecG [Oscillospiraceae bacterium]|nr:ATP-dependent DNA helicase RecG [Oscillospiraceae bacterium]
MGLEKSIQFIKGVGEKRAALFEKKGIKTVEDLLYFFPRSHEDRSKIKPIDRCEDGETVCIAATVYQLPLDRYVRRGMLITTMSVMDESGIMQLVWYNNKYIKNNFTDNGRYIFFGKVSRSKQGRIQMVAPVFEKYGSERFMGRIIPIYPLTAKLPQKVVQSTMELALGEAGTLEEYIPEHIREEYKIAELNFAMRNIHFPRDFESYNIARERFVFEELLVLQLALNERRGKNADTPGYVFNDAKCIRGFTDSLPFDLTGAQKRTINEICRDCKSGKQMNRLVQGDVGSGKTAVAAAAIYMTVRNGYQAAMMAPTEILAGQHMESLSQMFEKHGIHTVLLTGSMRAKEKRRVLEEIALGTAQVVIGTHAIIQGTVEFNNLGFVVADEQHRFGVEQRAKLMAKGNNPHMLIMSATPIPRTLALILYGDLDISIIDELPPGRKPVRTYAVTEDMRKRVYNFIYKNIKAGMQAYVVCPLVAETENSDLKNAEELAERLAASYPDINVGLMHGKMKAAAKDEVMSGFASGDINLLVATTVIEVGVNVPNANIMAIENAERFGLSQLHQLRGRVGRGGDQAHCILITESDSEVTKKRMETMCASNDGFYISEQDLKLRGPGDFFGTRQHGLPEMKIANLFEDRDILRLSQKAVKSLLDDGIENYPLLVKRCRALLSSEVIMN